MAGWRGLGEGIGGDAVEGDDGRVALHGGKFPAAARLRLDE
jgi:hypothetical protein